MKRQMIARSHFLSSNKQKIVQLCFDAQSINKFTPGLKMIFALDDPPLFVKLEEVEPEVLNSVIRQK